MKKINKITFLTLVLFFGVSFFCLAKNVYAATYYVDATGGLDSNNGTSSTIPWKTIAKVNASSFSPGDNILFKRGEIWREQLTIPSSGVTGNPISFGAYGEGDRPGIYGSQEVLGGDDQWLGPDSNGEFYLAILYQVKILARDGIRLNQGTVGELNTNEWAWSNNILYVKEDPSLYGVYEIGERNRGVYINNQDYIIIQNFSILYSNAWNIEANGNNIYISNSEIIGAPNVGIYFDDDNKNNNTINNCLIKDNDVAVWARGQNYFSFTNNNVTNNGPKFSSSPTTSSIVSIDKDIVDSDNLIIQDNTFENNSDFTRGSTGSSLVIYSCATSGLVSGNTFRNEGGTAILAEYMSGAVKNGLNIHNNYIENSYAGISIVDTSNSIIKQNYIENNNFANYATGIFLKGNTNNEKTSNNIVAYNQITSTGKSGQAHSGGIRLQKVISENYIYNNLIYNCENGIIFDESGGITDVVLNQIVKNNTIANTRNYHFRVLLNSGDNSNIDNNLYFPNESDKFLWKNSEYDFSQWQSVLRLDENSINADPLFVNAFIGNFHPQSTSPAIDAGINVSLTEDYDGNPIPSGESPDIGAFEYQQSPGTWSNWSSWGACSASCGGGTQSRTRTCTKTAYQLDCVGSTQETQTCNTQSCGGGGGGSSTATSVNGVWTDWSVWSVCSANCGGGKQARTRTCTNPTPQNGGLNCTGDSREERSCNTESCVVNNEQNDNIDSNTDTETESANSKANLSLTNLTNQPSTVVNAVSQLEANTVNNHNQKVNLDEAGIKLYAIVVNSQTNLTDQSKYSLAYFIHFGTPTTQILGSGERAGVINSYRQVFKKLPTTEAEWQDVIKIANGRWPTEKNLSAEEKTKTEIFKKIYNRAPNMSSPNDNAAVTVITYGLRPANRNMDSEKNGIKIFQNIFKYAPVSAQDWDMVRAISYSGARR